MTMVRPALATRAVADLRSNSTLAIEKAPIDGTSAYIEKPLKVLDSTAVARIKQELADVDKNADGR